MNNYEEFFSYTGAQFEVTTGQQSGTFVFAENTTLSLTFSINTSRCDQSSGPLRDINFITVERLHTSVSAGPDRQLRVCQFLHKNGSCVDRAEELGCFCSTDPYAPYQFITTADRSFNGIWRWSSEPDLVQAQNIDFVIHCRSLSCHLCVYF